MSVYNFLKSFIVLEMSSFPEHMGESDKIANKNPKTFNYNVLNNQNL